MNPLAERKLRFSDVVFAIDTTPKSLRKWLQNPEVSLISEQPEGEWKNFSLADIACLAIMRKLVDFCIGVPQANRVAKKIIRERLGTRVYSEHLPLTEFAGAFLNVVLAVWRNNDEWRFHLGSFTDDDFPSKKNAILFVQIDEVLKDAIDRAIEILNEGTPQMTQGDPWGPDEDFFSKWDKDVEGRQIYVGLTFEETKELRDLEDNLGARTRASGARYLELFEKHERARLIRLDQTRAAREKGGKP